MRIVGWSCVALALLPAAAWGQDGASRAAATITPDDVRRRIGVLAHDSMEGRNTPSRGLEKAAGYITAELRRLGLEPGGDAGTFVQRYTMQQIHVDTAASRVSVEGGPTFGFPTDAVRLFGGYDADAVTGPVLLVTGIADDPAALEKHGLGGQIVLYVPDTGPDGSYTAPARRTLIRLFQQRPAALVVVSSADDAGWARSAAAQTRAGLVAGWSVSEAPSAVLVRAAAIAPVLERHGHPLPQIATHAAAPLRVVPAPNLHLSVTVAPHVVRETTAPNVVGMLRGSDPTLRNEYIVFSAHMDHVGIGRPVNGDSIYNGADDDASGTAAVLELAEAYARLQPRPKRSMIFLLVSGEEKGLWGSDYFSTRPPVPIEQIVANVNIDMIGRNWRDTVVAIGREHSDLGATLDRVNGAHPELGMTIIDDPWPQERFYFRSDHFNFAKRGVPVLFFFTGTHEDYHGRGDHVEKIDAEKEARIVQLIFYLGLDVANAAPKPRWDPNSYEQIVGTERP